MSVLSSYPGGSAPLKPLFRRLAAFVALLTLAAAPVQAAPPTLTPDAPDNYAGEVQPGETRTFDVTYQQAEGDPPKSLKLVLETPGGEVTVPAQIPAGDPTKGIPVTWSYTPQNSGTYRLHFEATSATGESVRLPADPNNDYNFVSINPLTKYIVLAVGLVIALLFLPFVVYVTARTLNKHGDPAAAARIALLLGILSFCGLAWYLFLRSPEYEAIGIAIEVIAAGAFLVVLFSRRRAV